MKRTDPQLKIRLPQELKDWLEQEAARYRTSQSSEIARAIRERMERLQKEAA